MRLGAVVLTAMLLVSPAGAQDFPDVQNLTDKVLFATQDAATQRRLAEQRRVEALDLRAQQQAVQLQEQAQSVQALGQELRAIRDERQLIGLVDAFDAALVAGQWPSVRALLADALVVNIEGSPGWAAPAIAADDLVADLSRRLSRAAVLPRSNQQVSVAGDRAVVAADGYAWEEGGRGRQSLAQRFGRYEYRFARTAAGWKIDGLVFRRDAPVPAGLAPAPPVVRDPPVDALR